MFKTLRSLFSGYRNLKKKNNRNPHEATFQMIHNGEAINVVVYTIRNFRDKLNNLVFKDDLNHEIGYRYVAKKGTSTFGFRSKVDIIFCNINHSVIDFYEGIGPQKMTHYYPDAKFIYIFKQDFIRHFTIKINDILATKKMSQY
jgi:hypothetical protein